jgi:cyanate lyase
MFLKRDFKGIWIPKFIWENKDLTIMEKVFIVEIDSLDNEHGCFASNNYFAKFFNITPQRCSQIINSLVRKGFLSVKYEYCGKEVIKRVLNIFDTYKENFKKGIKKSLRGYQENVKDNNTYNNTLFNNILVYWNNKKIIIHNKLTDKIKSKINSTLKDYSENEIKKAIDNYNIVLKGVKYYFDYKWTLKDFLQRGIDKFMTDVCFDNYLANSEKNKYEKRQKPVKESKTPEHIVKNNKKPSKEKAAEVRKMIAESLQSKNITEV